MAALFKERKDLLNIARELPSNPGVYQYYNKEDKVIYVGKAKNLKKRVSSYFNRPPDSGKTAILISKIHRIEYLVVETELDALLLENNLIKKYQPRYNILLKDDKSYPWIVITQEDFPRVFSTRKKLKEKAKYFGPYPHYQTLKTILDLIAELYPLRTCSLDLSEDKVKSKMYKVCLEYHIGNCLGPCVNYGLKEEYEQFIIQIENLLKGNLNGVLQFFNKQMKEAAGRLEFEKAQQLKLRIESLEQYQSKSTIVSPTISDVEVLYPMIFEKWAAVNYMKIVNGAIIHLQTIEVKNGAEDNLEEMLVRTLLAMKEKYDSKSAEVITPIPMNTHIKGVKWSVPQRGDKLNLLNLAEKNVRYFLRDRKKEALNRNPEQNRQELLERMRKDLRMKELPKHIECFDNSNFQGTNAVAACVVFKNAKPSLRDYRHFNIKTVEGPDDFASMTEVVYRRYKRLLEENQDLPQLIVIDGGKGQLGAALKALEDLNLRGKIAILGIAKKLEELYFPGDPYPLHLDKRSETLKVIQNLRNEAHRFGISHHRNKRSKGAIKSELENISGIGPKSITALLKNFKTVEGVRTAKVEDLEMVLGKAKTKVILDYFKHKL